MLHNIIRITNVATELELSITDVLTVAIAVGINSLQEIDNITEEKVEEFISVMRESKGAENWEEVLRVACKFRAEKQDREALNLQGVRELGS